MECGTLRYCFYVPLYPTIMEVSKAAQIAVPLLALSGIAGAAMGAKKIYDSLPTSDGKEGEEERISDKPRNLMDPAMQKLKEMQQKRQQEQMAEKQRAAQTQNRQQMASQSSGSTTTGFDY